MQYFIITSNLPGIRQDGLIDAYQNLAHKLNLRHAENSNFRVLSVQYNHHSNEACALCERDLSGI